MTAISAFFRKTPVLRLKEYFTSGGFTSLAPVDWTKPEADVVEPLIKAVDGMTDDERQRVILDAGRVAALADEPGQNALQNVVLNRALFDTLEGANNRSLWVFLNENDRFRLAEEVRYNDERRRGRSWNGFEVEKDRKVRRDPVSVTAFTKAIRDRFDTPHVHVDIFDRHRVILEDQECDLVQVAVYREGRPEDMLGFDANSTLSRRIVKPVFEAALTYEADTGVIEVVANTLEDRRDLTAYMARDLLGIDFEEKHIPFRESQMGPNPKIRICPGGPPSKNRLATDVTAQDPPPDPQHKQFRPPQSPTTESTFPPPISKVRLLGGRLAQLHVSHV